MSPKCLGYMVLRWFGGVVIRTMQMVDWQFIYLIHLYITVLGVRV